MILLLVKCSEIRFDVLIDFYYLTTDTVTSPPLCRTDAYSSIIGGLARGRCGEHCRHQLQGRQGAHGPDHLLLLAAFQGVQDHRRGSHLLRYEAHSRRQGKTSIALLGKSALTPMRQGVTIASQQRYIRYYEKILQFGGIPPIRALYLNKLRVHTLPNFPSGEYSSLFDALYFNS